MAVTTAQIKAAIDALSKKVDDQFLALNRRLEGAFPAPPAPVPPAPVPPAPVPPPPASLPFRIGGNFGALDWAPCPWVDIVYNSRGFGLPTEYEENFSMPRDANGWPTVASRIVVCSNSQVMESPLGVYKGIYSGPGEMVAQGQENCRVSNIVRNGDSVTFDVTVTGPMTLIVAFSDAVRDLKILTPGYSVGTLLRTEALDFYKRFTCLRMMGAQDINDWQERARPETTWDRRMPAGKRGGKKPWEVHLEFLRAVYNAPDSRMKEAWLNIPLRADEDYIRQAALLSKQMLPADMIVYVEYANELWESGSGNLKVLVDASQNTSDIDYDKLPGAITDTWGRVAQLWAIRHARVASIWRSVLGERCRPVLAGQAANYYWTKLNLEACSQSWIADLFGPLTGHTKALALAPYLGTTTLEEMDAAPTASALLGMLRNDATQGLVTVGKRCKAFTDLAKLHGIPEVTSYEWGLHTHGGNNVAVKRAAHLDPAVESLVSDNVQAFKDAGMGLVCYHAASPQKHIERDVNSLWGVCETFTDQSPKLKGLGV